MEKRQRCGPDETHMFMTDEEYSEWWNNTFGRSAKTSREFETWLASVSESGQRTAEVTTTFDIYRRNDEQSRLAKKGNDRNVADSGRQKVLQRTDLPASFENESGTSVTA